MQKCEIDQNTKYKNGQSEKNVKTEKVKKCKHEKKS